MKMTEKDARLDAIKALELTRAHPKRIRQEIDALLCSDVYLTVRERSKLLAKIDDCIDKENQLKLNKTTQNYT